tara:strand:+ start:505 stop:1596 length:1092 start_codon:yes stop_codon:yes gene_type:complete
VNEKVVRVELGERSYNIHIGLNTLDTIGERIKQFHFSHKAVLISNSDLIKLYGERIILNLKKNGFEIEVIEVQDGEKYKNMREAEKIYDRLLAGKHDRYSPLIALGGGVLGDLTGFVAATYRRGVPYIQIPTSLLAQVDSSVGGKTAVNHSLGKNMIGAFYQPAGVFIDLNALKTLPEIEFRCGMAEIIKYGIIADEMLFNFLESRGEDIKNLNFNTLQYIIEASCKIKASIVSKDELEKGLRSVLNYGHTIGHALESLTGYEKYKHGEAVAIGMVAAAFISHEVGLCDKKDVERIKALIESFDLPTQLPEISPEKILSALYYDKKVKNDKVKLILIKKPGSVVIRDDIPDEIMLKSLKALTS